MTFFSVSLIAVICWLLYWAVFDPDYTPESYLYIPIRYAAVGGLALVFIFSCLTLISEFGVAAFRKRLSPRMGRYALPVATLLMFFSLGCMVATSGGPHSPFVHFLAAAAPIAVFLAQSWATRLLVFAFTLGAYYLASFQLFLGESHAELSWFNWSMMFVAVATASIAVLQTQTARDDVELTAAAKLLEARINPSAMKKVETSDIRDEWAFLHYRERKSNGSSCVIVLRRKGNRWISVAGPAARVSPAACPTAPPWLIETLRQASERKIPAKKPRAKKPAPSATQESGEGTSQGEIAQDS